MEITVKCKLVSVKKTRKGSYRCTFVTDKQDLVTSYIKQMNEEKIKSLAEMSEKRFSIPEDTILFYREENKTAVGEGV